MNPLRPYIAPPPEPRRFGWDDFIGAAFVLALVCGALAWGN